MPLARLRGDEFHHIESDLDATTIERWRVSTSHSRRSSDLRSSLKPTSWNPRSSSKTASWTTAAHRVVRLERVQEDVEDDDHPDYQPEPPQTPMETDVSTFLYIERPGLTTHPPGSDRHGEHNRIYRPCAAIGRRSPPGAFHDPQQSHTRPCEPVPHYFRRFRGKLCLSLPSLSLKHPPL